VKPTIHIIDDNPGFLRDGLLALELEGFEVRMWTEPGPMIEEIGSASGALVFFVDHDLGLSSSGYDVVREVRRTRADGLLVPIVYLTGRETEEGYLATEAADPYSAPSCYLNKRALIDVDLIDLVDSLSDRFAEALRLSEQQAARRAVLFFEDMPADMLWEG
jgi:CheY-like chemotaxis protein